jgi:hypothetical protein
MDLEVWEVEVTAPERRLVHVAILMVGVVV